MPAYTITKEGKMTLLPCEQVAIEDAHPDVVEAEYKGTFGEDATLTDTDEQRGELLRMGYKIIRADGTGWLESL